MQELISRLQREAERIASKYQIAEFYIRFKAYMALSRKLYFSDPVVADLRERVQPLLQEELGHGIFHCSRVGLDCATLIQVEMESDPSNPPHLERLMVLALIAGLLHDIRRGEKNHAEAGAAEAARILKDFPLTEEEVQCICLAIENHEAFGSQTPSGPPWVQLISDSLYDADKFRWGPDTFTHTLWHMADHNSLTPQELIVRFPWGIEGILRIRDTFRTATGRQYGPNIIDTGIEIGKEIYHYLVKHYSETNNDK
ncbi:MAG: hypothetical protein AB2L11_05600 [Syntrophobacteraceae bacterium]